MFPRKPALQNKEQKNIQVQFLDQFLHLITKKLFARHFLTFTLQIVLFVWTVWIVMTGPSEALANLRTHWEISLTMVFGSMIAGGTGMGGGAVAFPVLTKLLDIPPDEAKVFSLAIQSVGMTAASLTIVAMKTKVEWHFIRWASLGGIPGIILGSVFFAPVLPSDVIKFSFTMMVTSFGIVLFVLNKTPRRRNLSIPFWGQGERIFSLAVGILGGIISSLVGSGMDIVCFSIMILLFGLCEKVSTPTSVILMAINALAGLILHKYFIGDFVEPVTNYWLAAVPIVVVGAPTGAMLCSLLTRKTIARIVISLISIELITSCLLIPLNPILIFSSLLMFVLFLSIYWWIYQIKTYI